MHGLGAFSHELPNCIDVEMGRYELKVLGMDRIIASKRAANRAKDRLVIPVLEDTLAANKVASRRAKTKSAVKRKPVR
jgi:hypothetical protein